MKLFGAASSLGAAAASGRTPRSATLRIGLAFNLKPTLETAPGDFHAEWDDDVTITAVAAALAEVGEVIRLEATEDFPSRLRDSRPDILFNLAEGLGGSNREGHVPAFCEFWSIPYVGSDVLALCTCLDKGRTKEILSRHGISTPAFKVVCRSKELDDTLALPLIVKPNHEGSSKGITQDSFCQTMAEAKNAIATVVERYNQPALVEHWLPGREFTCGIVGNGDEARVLPIVEIDFDALPPRAARLYSYEAKWIWDTPERPLDVFRCPAPLAVDLASRVERTALEAYRVLRCRDWARIDIRCDSRGVPNVLDVNPIPGVLPDPRMNSCFPKAARAAGLDFSKMILAVLTAGATRYGITV